MLKIWRFDEVFESAICFNTVLEKKSAICSTDLECLITEQISNYNKKEKVTALKEVSFMNRIGPDGALFFVIGNNNGKTKIYSLEKKDKIAKKICLMKSSDLSFESNSAITDIIICDPFKTIFTSSNDNKIILFDSNLNKIISLEYHNKPVLGLKFANNFSSLISFDTNNQIFTWNCLQFLGIDKEKQKNDPSLRKHKKKKVDAHPTDDNGIF